jgi:uncharacterized membrane protein YedE/YeeE
VPGAQDDRHDHRNHDQDDRDRLEHEAGEAAQRQDENERAGASERGPWFTLVVLLGGIAFGVWLAVSEMAKPEVVLDFLQFDDLGLLFVMGGAAVVSGLSFLVGSRVLDRAPLTGRVYGRRLKEFDQNVVVGGVVFGVGWGISGICPGAAYASLGVGNLPILWGVAGMFLGAYAQGYWRSRVWPKGRLAGGVSAIVQGRVGRDRILHGRYKPV